MRSWLCSTQVGSLSAVNLRLDVNRLEIGLINLILGGTQVSNSFIHLFIHSFIHSFILLFLLLFLLLPLLLLFSTCRPNRLTLNLTISRIITNLCHRLFMIILVCLKKNNCVILLFLCFSRSLDNPTHLHS